MNNLENLLVQFMVPDNNARKAAEEQIRKLSKDSQIVPALVQLVRSAQDPAVRQLAAVILRKKITGHWMRLAQDVKNSSKATLLESVTMDPAQPVRRASANVVSVIAKHAVPSGEWPELLPFLFQCTQSVQEDHREVALIVFNSLTETIGDVLRPHFGTLQSVFVNGLNDQHSNRVRIAALKAVGALVGYIQTEEEVVMFRELIPPILSVSRHCLESGDEDVAVLAFEIFDELVESPAPLLGPTIPVIVHFALEVCSNKSLESNTRYQAIQIVSWLAKYKPKTLVRHKLVGPILTVMCPILAEPDARRSESDVSSDRAAAEVLDTMAMSLPKKHVFPPVLDFSMANFKNPDHNWREAAVMALGVISEGCYEVMKSQLDDVLNLVLEALNDSEKMVRGAASFALGQFAEHLQPEIVEHYQRVLPCIFTVLNDFSPEVQEKAYYALAAFCENLKEEILPYLGPLMEKLLAALQSGRHDLQETCMSAIGSAAAAAESAFVPYVETLLKMLQTFMLSTKDEDLPIRARATELVGIVGIAVGRPVIEPVLPFFIEAVLNGFSLDFSELREYSHGFFSNVAEILEEKLEPYLPRMVPVALASCNLDDGTALNFGDSSDEGENEVGGLGALSSDDDDDEGNKGFRNISVRTGVLDEKAAATQALGLFALHTKQAYMPRMTQWAKPWKVFPDPGRIVEAKYLRTCTGALRVFKAHYVFLDKSHRYLEETLNVLKKHAGYFHEDVRLQAMIALLHILTATLAAFPNRDNHISRESKHVLDVLMEAYLRALNEDDDKDVVAQVCSSIVEVFKSVPFEAVQQYIVSLSEATLTLLRQQANCQMTDDLESDDEEEEEHDEILMDAVTDLLPAMGSCLGPAFESYFRQFFEPLMKFTGHTKPPSDRTMAIACVAEVANKIGPAIVPYIDVVMPVALKELSSPEPTNRRNAAYCIGELCKHGGANVLRYYQNILVGMYPLFAESETDDGVKDNAAGAVARMISAHPQAIPLNQVLPVFIKSLPLKEDIEESASVYGCLCNLIFASQQDILPFVQQLVPVFAQAVSSEEVNSEVKSVIGKAVSQLWNQYREQMQPLLASLPPQEANLLGSVMNQN